MKHAPSIMIHHALNNNNNNNSNSKQLFMSVCQMNIDFNRRTLIKAYNTFIKKNRETE